MHHFIMSEDFRAVYFNLSLSLSDVRLSRNNKMKRCEVRVSELCRSFRWCKRLGRVSCCFFPSVAGEENVCMKLTRKHEWCGGLQRASNSMQMSSLFKSEHSSTITGTMGKLTPRKWADAANFISLSRKLMCARWLIVTFLELLPLDNISSFRIFNPLHT